MLSQINKRKISFKLNQIYNFLPKNEIDLIAEEISQIINHFNISADEKKPFKNINFLTKIWRREWDSNP